MLIRVLVALLATTIYGYGLSVILPGILAGKMLDGVTLMSLGGVTFTYGFAMTYLLSKKYREEMNGPDDAPTDGPEPPKNAA